MHKVGDKVPTVDGAAQPATWQANTNLADKTAVQETQVVLSQVATLQAEFDKLTGEFDSQNKRIDDANAVKTLGSHQLDEDVNTIGNKDDAVAPSIFAGTELYTGMNSPRLQPADATTVIIDSQEDGCHSTIQQNQVFRVPTTVASTR